jgi:apolipoprotein N-acyltransferase
MIDTAVKTRSLLKHIEQTPGLYYTLMVLGAIMWGLGQFPELFFFRFFGLVPLLYVVHHRKRYKLEWFLYALIGYCMNFYWLVITFIESGKLPVILAVAIPILFCAWYASSYPLIALIYRRFSRSRWYLVYSLPVIYVFIDFLFPRLFIHTISDSMIGFLPLVQVIDITGMSGLTLMLIGTNLGLYMVIERFVTGRRISWRSFLFLVPLVLMLGYGTVRLLTLTHTARNSDFVRASMIQGNITGKQKLDEKFFTINTDRYNNLTMKAIADESPDLVIWPESVFNRVFDLGNKESLDKFLYNRYPPLILGVVSWLRGSASNTAILVKNGEKVAQYDKKHLLVFGEYIPFEETFPFLRMLSPISYNIQKGTSSSIMITGKIKASISICFEDIFPDEIRRNVNEGSNLMINITNDSWFGNGRGPLHHSVLARLRGIENRRSFYRCTATGYTTASDFTGKIIADGPIGEEAFITGTLPLYEGRSVYSYIGELLSWICVLSVILMAAWLLRSWFIDMRKSESKRVGGSDKTVAGIRKEKRLRRF